MLCQSCSNKASIYTRKTIPRNEKKWITIHSNPKRGSDLAIFISQTVTPVLRQFDQDERESDGSRHWEAFKSVLLRKFERDGVRDFHDEVCLQKIFEGSSKKRIEYCKNNDGIFMLLTSDSRAFWRYSNRTRIDGLCLNSSKLEEILIYIYISISHKGFSCNFQSILEHGLIPAGKEKDKARQAVFLTPTNIFGDGPEEEKPHDDFTVPQKASYVTKWKYYQNAVYLVRLSKAQDQGLEIWQTKSFAIMTNATIPGGCIDRVTSQKWRTN